MFVLLAIFVACLCYAMWSDAVTFKIPNVVSIILIVTFAAFAVLQLDVVTTAQHAGVALAVFVVAFLFYALGWMGAGDVKLIGAVSLWAGPGVIASFLIVMAMLGAGVAIVLLVVRSNGAVWRGWAGRWPVVGRLLDIAEAGKVPYGIPIGLAALWSAKDIFPL